MKKIALCIALSSLAVACDVDDQNEIPCQEFDEITISALVGDITKAPINSGFTTDFPIGIYANNTNWVSGTSANVINNDNATVLGAAGHSITFGSGPYYYPTDGSTINLFAFAPRGTESTAAGTGAAPVVTIAMTGREDIMYATASGTKATATPLVFAFAHKLTQLQFTLKAATGYPTNNSVISLKVNAQPTSAIMNVGTGDCTFSGSTPMEVLASSEVTNGVGITTAGAVISSPIMTQTGTGASAYTITVVVKQGNSQPNVTYTAVPVNVSSVIGSAHMITVTFTESAIAATASVADWLPGSGGSSSIL